MTQEIVESGFFKWTVVDPNVKRDLTTLLLQKSIPHIPEDLLIGNGISVGQLRMSGLLLEYATLKLICDPNSEFPSVVSGESPNQTREAPFSIALCPEMTCPIELDAYPDIKGGFIFSRHPKVATNTYQSAIQMVFLQTNQMLREIGLPSLPDHGDILEWMPEF